MTAHRPELSRRVPLGRIGAGGLEQDVEASPAECRALAQRLQLPAVASLTCRFRLSPPLAGQVAAEAALCAEVTQLCVVSLEPFEAVVSERFALRFVPEGAEEEDIDPEAPDEIVYLGDAIDLGETAAEQLALALDPYPRMPGLAPPLPPEPPAEAEPERPNPFAALARLGRGTGSGEG